MTKIGITGQGGFVGTHLYNTLQLQPDSYELIAFDKSFFNQSSQLDAFVANCDVIVHLAAMNRHPDAQVIYDTNLVLVTQLIDSLERSGSTAYVLMSSSTQEEQDNLYGQSKKEGRQQLENWSRRSNGSFTGLIIPNVFGPFGKPDYNSVVATFCHKLTCDEDPQIHQDGQLKLIYVGELVEEIISLIDLRPIKNYIEQINPTSEVKVSELLVMLNRYKSDYYQKGIIPPLDSTFEVNLFNTFRSFIDPSTHFPVRFNQHHDTRGTFVEVIRLNVGGQVSFSTTVPGITRGNHFHTRKIERFSVIKGKARIQLRKIGTSEVLDIELSGSEAGYVDMPIWFTHNITNTGNEDLYTIFWINEFYNPEDADTYFEEV